MSTVSNITSGSDDDAMAAQLCPHAGFVKSILQIGFMQISLEDWDVCRETLARGLRLLDWLRGVDETLDERGEAVYRSSDMQALFHNK